MIVLGICEAFDRPTANMILVAKPSSRLVRKSNKIAEESSFIVNGEFSGSAGSGKGIDSVMEAVPLDGVLQHDLTRFVFEISDFAN